MKRKKANKELITDTSREEIMDALNDDGEIIFPEEIKKEIVEYENCSELPFFVEFDKEGEVIDLLRIIMDGEVDERFPGIINLKKTIKRNGR